MKDWTLVLALALAALALPGAVALAVTLQQAQARAAGPEACPFGAARTYVGGWMCLTEADRDFAAETCYTGEGCETPDEHATHGEGMACLLLAAVELQEEEK